MVHFPLLVLDAAETATGLLAALAPVFVLSWQQTSCLKARILVTASVNNLQPIKKAIKAIGEYTSSCERKKCCAG